jgi:GntR family transcriptional regulator/MocR family aminotransferase
VDLLIDLPREGRGPLRRRLERELREAVRAGRLLPGAALPSTRVLAAQLGVSRGLVVEAYGQLVAEGYLSARQGAATVVAARARAGVAPQPQPQAPDAAAGSWPRRDRPQGAPANGGSVPGAGVGGSVPGRRAGPPPRYDFRYGTPNLSAFPRSAWQAAGARALRSLPDARLGYGDPRGEVELREALAAYLGRARGVVADPQRLLITGGTRLGMTLLWSVLRAAGATRVAIENPGWAAQHDTARHAGLQPVPVGVDEHGLCVGELAALGVDAVVLTPAHQCPTGAVLSPRRRAELLEWARDQDALVVEDDYDAEYRYDRDPVGALQGMAPDHVAYAGSASKTLAPALRVGWMLLPAPLAAAATRHTAAHDRGEALLTQLTLADLISRGELDRHLRRMRRRYRARRDALVEAIGSALPGARVDGIAAGLHALVRLPAGADEAATVRAAAGRGIALDGLAGFVRGGPPAPPSLVLGYGNLAEPAIARGIAELARALR